jgi:hypothetical protein
LTNWLSLLLLGMWSGQRPTRDVVPHSRGVAPLPEIAALITLALAWPRMISAVGLVEDFPFARIVAPSVVASLVATSAAVSFLYLAYTVLVFRITTRLAEHLAVRFLAENTLIVFIIHMPLVYLLAPRLYSVVPHGPGGILRMLVNLMVFFVLPACASQIIRQIMAPQRWREWLLDRARAMAGAQSAQTRPIR